MDKKDVTITISGGSASGKTTVLSFLAIVLQCVQTTAGKGVDFIIDPTSQTLREGDLLTEDDLNVRLESLINGEKLRIVLKDQSESRIIL